MSEKLSLPIDTYISEICSLIKSQQNLVLTAAPGAGKTTRLPAALMRQFDGKILVLEPRRMAALAAASRIAEENLFTLGDEVGYQVRFANKYKNTTRLIFMTEALLARKLLDDPELKGVDLIILDEFHERSLHVDLSLGLIREMQELGHPIKLIVMSATIDASKIALFLGNAPIVQVPGKTFPLEINYSKQSQILKLTPAFYEKLAETIKEALTKTTNDILVFLPGVGEIERAKDKLIEWLTQKNIEIQVLHGSLNLEDQRKVLKPHQTQRVILSTNIAESSVTLDGVQCVIDSGLAKVMRHDYRTGFSRLELSRISLGSSVQRAGRAARQGPGLCYKMWNTMDEQSMQAYEAPEVQRSDLSEALLYLANQGITDFSKFTWFEPPPSQAMLKSTSTLQFLEALDLKLIITELGKNILRQPLPIRLARLVLEAETLNQASLGAKLAAILQEKDFLKKESHQNLSDDSESDLAYRLHILEEFLIGKKVYGVSIPGIQIVKQSYDQIMSQFKLNPKMQNTPWDLKDIHKLIISAYKDRLCRRRGKGTSALMSTGRGIALSIETFAKTSEFFFALDGVESGNNADTTISIAHACPKDWLMKEYSSDVKKDITVFFDENKNSFHQKNVKELWGLIIEESAPQPASPSIVEEKIPEILLSKLEWLRKENEFFNSFIEKINFLKKHSSFLNETQITALLSIFDSASIREDFLKDIFQQIAVGESNLKVVAVKDFQWIINNSLPAEITKLINDELPNKLEVPSGSLIKVNYPEDKNPYIEVRIQEIFGWMSPPKVLRTMPITIHLLGPNYRPVQVTSDLTSFWQNAYPEVRKELRLKYPKHQWPENPMHGVAEAKGKPRRY